jgi:hypothetical protein
MIKADCVFSTPPTNTPTSQSNPVDATSRRRFLTNAAGAAAGGTALVLATPPVPAAAAIDPVFDLIAAHKKIVGTIDVIEAEHRRLLELNMLVSDDEITEPASIEMGLFFELLEIVPTTVAGVVALVTYLDEVNKKDPWKFEDNHATPLIGNLAEAFNRIAAAS